MQESQHYSDIENPYAGNSTLVGDWELSYRKVNISPILGTYVQESHHYSDIESTCAGKSTLDLRLLLLLGTL